MSGVVAEEEEAEGGGEGAVAEGDTGCGRRRPLTATLPPELRVSARRSISANGGGSPPPHRCKPQILTFTPTLTYKKVWET